MSVVQKICNKLSKYISLNLELDKDKEEVIEYGIFACIQTTYSILCIIIVGFFLNVLKEAIIFSFSASFLRRTSGGVHSSTPNRCAITGAIVSGIVSWLIKNVIVYMNLNIFLPIGVAIFLISYYLISKLAPVDSKSKPIKSKEKRNMLRKKSIKIWGTLFLISVSSMYFYYIYHVDLLLTFSICISAGVLWQVLSLTYLGQAFINFTDIIFNKIFVWGWTK
ncbi:accessory gene regulator ArgB-like protein [Haloimpatiens lingqiaonensis]|uniref:accessory gene regulator ArgB-like protein n=1 Tax=Haloimpatiens lingqiaonensis TaxID=1380675 RepID=UPI001485837F|nr:accessory gene regulator B family protein [Haloimpatiens lingqiaonensis]